MTAGRERSPLLPLWPAGLVGAVLIVGILRIITPEYDVRPYKWDSFYYFDMAARGLSGNDQLRAPFAYRVVTPWLARQLAGALRLPLEEGFRILAYVGGVAQLVLALQLARSVSRSRWAAMVTALVVALSLFNVRFLLFDPYRPDVLGYPLFLGAALALVRGRLAACYLVAAGGLFVREFMIVPLLALLDHVWRTPRENRVVPIGVWAWLVGLAVVAGLWLPRQMIPVAPSLTDPTHSDSLRTLLLSPFSFWRDVNMAYAAAAYLLPTLALANAKRLGAAWRALAPYRRLLLVYTALVLILAMYGGTDLPRFMAYLVVPQTLLLAGMLGQGIHRLEVSVALVLTAMFNRVFVVSLPSEPSVEFLLDFYSGYADRVNLVTMWRAGELIGSLLLVRLVRHWLARGAVPSQVSSA
ncbi:MAG: hypothetical protein ACREKS_02950 [Candidatus Rokuibacteriota bacterium]